MNAAGAEALAAAVNVAAIGMVALERGPVAGVGLDAASDKAGSGRTTTLTFIIYALWANRGPSQMRVHVTRS